MLLRRDKAKLGLAESVRSETRLLRDCTVVGLRRFFAPGTDRVEGLGFVSWILSGFGAYSVAKHLHPHRNA